MQDGLKNPNDRGWILMPPVLCHHFGHWCWLYNVHTICHILVSLILFVLLVLVAPFVLLVLVGIGGTICAVAGVPTVSSHTFAGTQMFLQTAPAGQRSITLS